MALTRAEIAERLIIKVGLPKATAQEFVDKFFEEIAAGNATVFCFESPFRVGKTLAEIAEVMPDAQVALIREATKLHEEILRGSALELAAVKREWKGEFVIGIRPNAESAADGEEND